MHLNASENLLMSQSLNLPYPKREKQMQTQRQTVLKNYISLTGQGRPNDMTPQQMTIKKSVCRIPSRLLTRHPNFRVFFGWVERKFSQANCTSCTISFWMRKRIRAGISSGRLRQQSASPD